MRKLLLLVAFVVTIVGCSQSLTDDQVCGYCDGDIFYIKSKEGVFSTEYKKQYLPHEGKAYHPWCYKIITSEKCK